MNIIRAFKSVFGGRIPFGNHVATLINGQLVNNLQNTMDYVTNGYSDNPVLYSIISQFASKFASVPRHVYEVVNNAEFKRYKSLTSGGGMAIEKSYSEGMMARK